MRSTPRSGSEMSPLTATIAEVDCPSDLRVRNSVHRSMYSWRDRSQVHSRPVTGRYPGPDLHRCSVILAMLRHGTHYQPPTTVPTHDPATPAASDKNAPPASNRPPVTYGCNGGRLRRHELGSFVFVRQKLTTWLLGELLPTGSLTAFSAFDGGTSGHPNRHKRHCASQDPAHSLDTTDLIHERKRGKEHQCEYRKWNPCKDASVHWGHGQPLSRNASVGASG